MTIIVDAVFVLTLAMQFPNGDIPTAALTYPNFKECTAARAEKLEQARKVLAANTDGLKFFISSCHAIPVEEVR